MWLTATEKEEKHFVCASDDWKGKKKENADEDGYEEVNGWTCRSKALKKQHCSEKTANALFHLAQQTDCLST